MSVAEFDQALYDECIQTVYDEFDKLFKVFDLVEINAINRGW